MEIFIRSYKNGKIFLGHEIGKTKHLRFYSGCFALEDNISFIEEVLAVHVDSHCSPRTIYNEAKEAECEISMLHMPVIMDFNGQLTKHWIWV